MTDDIIPDGPPDDGPSLEDAKAAQVTHEPDPAAIELPTDVRDGAAGEDEPA